MSVLARLLQKRVADEIMRLRAAQGLPRTAYRLMPGRHIPRNHCLPGESPWLAPTTRHSALAMRIWLPGDCRPRSVGKGRSGGGLRQQSRTASRRSAGDRPRQAGRGQGGVFRGARNEAGPCASPLGSTRTLQRDSRGWKKAFLCATRRRSHRRLTPTTAAGNNALRCRRRRRCKSRQQRSPAANLGACPRRGSRTAKASGGLPVGGIEVCLRGGEYRVTKTFALNGRTPAYSRPRSSIELAKPRRRDSAAESA